MGATEHLSSYQLEALGRDIVWKISGDVAVDLSRRPGQHVIAQMIDILAAFRGPHDREVVPLYRPNLAWLWTPRSAPTTQQRLSSQHPAACCGRRGKIDPPGGEVATPDGPGRDFAVRGGEERLGDVPLAGHPLSRRGFPQALSCRAGDQGGQPQVGGSERGD